MRALKFITGHVIYNPAYTYKFQLKTTLMPMEFLFTFDVPVTTSNSKNRRIDVSVMK